MWRGARQELVWCRCRRFPRGRGDGKQVGTEMPKGKLSILSCSDRRCTTENGSSARPINQLALLVKLLRKLGLAIHPGIPGVLNCQPVWVRDIRVDGDP
jgi:hypothetical protein